MEITLKRIARKDAYTIGKLYINGVYICDTIEDADRLYWGKSKIKGQTAIPCGRYEITQNVFSSRFGNRKFYKDLCEGFLPRLLNVPQFEGVLIHCGNYAGAEFFFKKLLIPKGKELLQTDEYIEVV